MAQNDVCVGLEYCLKCKVRGIPVFVSPVALSYLCFYRPTMFVIVVAVVVVAVFIDVVIIVVVLGDLRPPHGTLPPCHPPNGENKRTWV